MTNHKEAMYEYNQLRAVTVVSSNPRDSFKFAVSFCNIFFYYTPIAFDERVTFRLSLASTRRVTALCVRVCCIVCVCYCVIVIRKPTRK